jgi:hypothetical protein
VLQDYQKRALFVFLIFNAKQVLCTKIINSQAAKEENEISKKYTNKYVGESITQKYCSEIL